MPEEFASAAGDGGMRVPKATEDRLDACQPALMESVDCWPLAITFARHSGVSPCR